MINDLKVLAIIPARGGSKGLPKKNIYLLNNKPLIAYTIDASIGSKYIDKTIVSSDSDEILSIAETLNVDILKRPADLASDTTPTEPVIKHVLENFPGYDLLILLQPTSPLRTASHIDAALELLVSKQATSLISVFEPGHSPYKSFKENNRGYLEGLIDNKTPFMRRQDLPKVYIPNGAIYIAYANIFLKSGSLFSEKAVPFVMDAIISIDIDNEEDVKRVSDLIE